MRAWCVLVVLGLALMGCPEGATGPERVPDDGWEASEGPYPIKIERFGGLRLGLAAEDVTAMLGEPGEKGEQKLMEATGVWLQIWSWPNQGVEVGMGSISEGGGQTVESFWLRPGCTMVNGDGVGVGADRADVESRYGQYAPKDEPKSDDGLIVGSVYGGVIFDFEGGVVSSIFVGAGAE